MTRSALRRIVLASVVLTGASGCLDWSNDIPCRTSRHCVSGYACVEGYCVPSENADAGPSLQDGGASVNLDGGNRG